MAQNAYAFATTNFSQLSYNDLAFWVTEGKSGCFKSRSEIHGPSPDLKNGSRGKGHVPGTFLLVVTQWSLKVDDAWAWLAGDPGMQNSH